jgi:aspartyl protease family protein
MISAIRRGRRGVGIAAALLAGGLAVAAPAQTVTYNGMLGERALLVIDGQAQAVTVGATVHGLKLLRVDGSHAQVEIDGKRLSLQLGGSFRAPGGEAGGSGSRIVLTAGPGGHFVGTATINGHPTRFMVDTGATSVSIGRDEADRLGLDYAHGGVGGAMTANGAVEVRTITLTTVRVGDVLVADVPATVVPQAMPYVLLGNSFLARFRMQREDDTMVLEKKN